MKRSLRCCFLLVGLMMTSCGELPRLSWEGLKEVHSRVSTSEAARWLPDEARSFEEHYVQLREEYILLESRWFWMRSGKRLTLLTDEITQLHRKGEELLRKSAGLRRERMEKLRLEVAVLEYLLDPKLDRILLPSLRLQQTTAALQLARLRFHLAEDDLWSAEAVLQELRTSSREFSDHVDRLEQRFSNPDLLEDWSRDCEKAANLSRRTRRGALVVDKYHRKVVLLEDGQPRKSFDADLGWNGLNDKLHQGDGATPEGEYSVKKLKGEGETSYHRALLLNYPNASDQRDFNSLVSSGGLPKDARIGNLIEIHGEGGRGKDWTDGCVALKNHEMEILYRNAYVGMPVFVVGKCAMTP